MSFHGVEPNVDEIKYFHYYIHDAVKIFAEVVPSLRPKLQGYGEVATTEPDVEAAADWRDEAAADLPDSAPIPPPKQAANAQPPPKQAANAQRRTSVPKNKKQGGGNAHLLQAEALDA